MGTFGGPHCIDFIQKYVSVRLTQDIGRVKGVKLALYLLINAVDR